MEDKKRNNPSWCCDQIEELIQKYRNQSESLYLDESIARTYGCVADELEEILYGE